MKGSIAMYIVLSLLVILAILLRLKGSPILYQRSWPPADTSLGKSHEGVHKFHISDTAIFDMLGTVLMSLFFAFLSKGSVTFWLILLLLVSEIMHGVYGIPTSTQVWLFGSPVNQSQEYSQLPTTY